MKPGKVRILVNFDMNQIYSLKFIFPLSSGLHDRERSWQLKHFCSNNAHAYRREKASKIVPAGDGEFKISGGGRDEYLRPKTVQDCQKAINNYRSALHRLWPWDWTAEVRFYRISET